MGHICVNYTIINKLFMSTGSVSYLFLKKMKMATMIIIIINNSSSMAPTMIPIITPVLFNRQHLLDPAK